MAEQDEQPTVVGGEAELPDEHTARVRARSQQAEQPAPTVHKVHDQTEVDVPKSSSEMAEPSRRERRRARDKRAERRAMQVLLGVFLGLGGLALVGVNLMLEDPPPASATDAKVEDGEKAKPPPPPPRRQPGVFTAAPVEEVDVPALRSMRTEGLTIAAEGLPEVLTDATGTAVGPLAALETCRFAFGVWEFSPNKRFRFLTTCGALEGQVLYGAYEVRGENVHLSALTTQLARITSTFKITRPSKMTTKVESLLHGKVFMEFKVNQHVNVMRPGLEGEGFYGTYAAKNTVTLPAQIDPDGAPDRRRNLRAPPTKAPAKGKAKTKDPLLDLLKEN